MAKSNHKNIDAMFDAMAGEFLKADKVLKDESSLNLVTNTLLKLEEMQNFKRLFKTYYLPNARKASIDLKNSIKKSKYKKFISATYNYNESVHETIRLGIVGLYHKYESYRKELIENLSIYITEKNHNVNLKQYAIDKYNFKISENWKNINLFELNWLCNRIKHDSALPFNKEHPNREVPEKFQSLDKNKKLEISSDDLMAYADSTYTYCHDLFQLFFKIANRSLFDDDETYGDTGLIKNIMDAEIAQLINKLNTK